MLTLEFVRVTEAAAVNAGRLAGKISNKMGADQLAVDGMHSIVERAPRRDRRHRRRRNGRNADAISTKKVGAGGTAWTAVDLWKGRVLTARGRTDYRRYRQNRRQGQSAPRAGYVYGKALRRAARQGRIRRTSPCRKTCAALPKRLERSIDDRLSSSSTANGIGKSRLTPAGAARIKLITDGDVSPAVDVSALKDQAFTSSWGWRRAGRRVLAAALSNASAAICGPA